MVSAPSGINALAVSVCISEYKSGRRTYDATLCAGEVAAINFF